MEDRVRIGRLRPRGGARREPDGADARRDRGGPPHQPTRSRGSMTTSIAIRSPKRRLGRRTPSRVSPVAVCVVGAAALVSLVPFVFLLAVSMTPSNGGGAGSLWVELFEQVPVGLYMLNSAIVTL